MIRAWRALPKKMEVVFSFLGLWLTGIMIIAKTYLSMLVETPLKVCEDLQGSEHILSECWSCQVSFTSQASCSLFATGQAKGSSPTAIQNTEHAVPLIRHSLKS